MDHSSDFFRSVNIHEILNDNNEISDSWTDICLHLLLLRQEHRFSLVSTHWTCDLLPVWPDGKIKSSHISPKVAQNVEQIVFTLKVMLFKKSPQVSRYLGYFWNKICCQEISKIAQSGRAVYFLYSFNVVKNIFQLFRTRIAFARFKVSCSSSK